MTSASFGGTGTSVIGYTQSWVHVGGISLPTGRNAMANGISYAYIVTMGAYVTGRGASRTIQIGFEVTNGYTNAFGVGSGSSASYTGGQACAVLTNGGTDTFRIISSGSFYFGRGGAGGPSVDSFGTNFANVLYGDYVYYSAPSVPLTPAVTGPTTTTAAVTWSAPSDNGDTAVTGYRVDYSTSPTFASGVTSFEVGNVLTYVVTGLVGSTAYYFRVFAENAATAAAGSWSAASSTVNLTTGAGGAPPTATVALQSALQCAFVYPTASVGFWSFWMTQSTSSWYVSVSTAGTLGGANLLYGVDSTVGFWASTTTGANPMVDGPTYLPAGGFAGTHRFSVGVAASFASGTWTFPLTLYVDGVQVATGSSATLTPPATFTNAARQPVSIQVGTLGAVGSAVISRLSHTLTLAHEEYAIQATEAGYLSAAAASTGQVTLGALPADLSAAPVGYLMSSGQTTLDSMNLIMKTEQGYLDCVTNGSLTNPVQTVRVRSRQRPAAVAYAFDAQAEVSGAVNFVRDSTNLIWSDVVTGANSTTQTVSQLALQVRAGSNNSADTVATYRPSDLYEFGTDRLWRGQNVTLRPVAIVIDNLTCPTDRSSDLLNMVPGDRVQITNIPLGPSIAGVPQNILGFTTWDGWLLDKEQSHKSGPNAEDRFTLYLQPVQPATAVYDTDLYANGGNNTISTALTSGATSMLCVSTDLVTYFEQVAVPYTLKVDSELVTVTACNAPSAGIQTLTVTRGVVGTIAAAHSVGAVPEVVTNSLFAF